MTFQWIDGVAGIAYIVIRGPTAYVELLDAIDRLTSDPVWRPGMPIIEDLRDYRSCLRPPSVVEQWSRSARDRRRALNDCRWARPAGGWPEPRIAARHASRQCRTE
jgi:hypothetical protein